MQDLEAVYVITERIKLPKYGDTYGSVCEADYQQEAVDAAASALCERIERSKGCEFCCFKEHPDNTLYPKEGYMFYAGYSKQMSVDSFDELETNDVKYCPCCGRSLTEEKHENVSSPPFNYIGEEAVERGCPFDEDIYDRK